MERAALRAGGLPCRFYPYRGEAWNPLSGWLRRLRVVRLTSSPTVHEDKQPPVATFKTSRRDWQARCKMRCATQVLVYGKAYNQAERAAVGLL